MTRDLQCTINPLLIQTLHFMHGPGVRANPDFALHTLCCGVRANPSFELHALWCELKPNSNVPAT